MSITNNNTLRRIGVHGLALLVAILAPSISAASVEWLLAQQQADGSIATSNDIATPLQASAEAVRALRAAGRADAVGAADNFIAAESYHGTEYLSRKIVSAVEAGAIPSQLIGDLVSRQNPDGGYGELAGYSSNALDTAHALAALAVAGQTTTQANLRAINYLVAAQTTAGAWAGPSDLSVFVTAHVVRSLWPFRLSSPAAVSAIGKAKQYLLAERLSSGTWSSDFETALVLLALIPVQVDPTELDASEAALLASRSVDGSWAGDVYTTALAMQALVAAAAPNPNPDLGAISGRVVDGDTLSSIVGATITLEGSVSREMQSDGQGGFQFAPLPAGTYTLQVEAAGYPALTSTVRLSTAQTVDLGAIRLLRTEVLTHARIEGHLTNQAGEDLAGVVVAVTGREPVATDATGRFVINQVTPGAATITASLDGYFTARGETVLVAGATVIFSPVLRALDTSGFSLTGTFTDSVTSAPLAGVTVQLSGANTLSVSTDAMGSVSLADLTPGETVIAVSLEGYGARTAVIHANGGETFDISAVLTPIDPEAPATFSLSGRLTDQASGAALSGATVQVQGAVSASTSTDSDGRYSLSGLAPGPITLTASAIGYQSASASATALAQQHIDFSPALTRADERRIGLRGRVTDAETGDALAGAEVALTVDGASQLFASGSAGEFLVTNLPSSVIELSISSTGYETRSMRLTLVEGFINDVGAIALRALEYGPPQQLSGRVVDSTNSAALPDTTVNIMSVNGAESLRTGANGEFEFTAAAGETIELEFVRAGYLTSQFTVTVVDGDTDLGEVRLRPEGLDTLHPDLVPTIVDASSVVTDATTYAVSGSATVHIANQGHVAAGAGAEIVVFEDRNRDGEVGADEPVLGRATLATDIEAGASDALQIALVGTTSFRDAPITALVDAGHIVIEREESNNVARSSGLCLAVPPAASALEPVLKWHWNGSPQAPTDRDVFGPVIVGQMSDDNGDGRIDALDVPDVVFPSRGQRLTVVSGDDGRTIWQSAPNTVTGLGSAALGDIDNDGFNEIVISNGRRTRLLAFEHDGTLKWDVPNSPTHSDTTRDGITIADLNADGAPEIVTGRRVYSNTGALLWQGTGDHGGMISYGTLPIAADLDGDGLMEVIAGRTAYRYDGTQMWHQSAAVGDGFNAIGNFDADDSPEIVLVTTGRLYLFEHTGQIKWGPISISGGGSRGGAPTVGDFDGDGEPEIGIAGRDYYSVYETDGSLKWRRAIDDASSAFTGSSLFDFDGDGRTEVVYADENSLFIYDGATGTELIRIPNGSGTTLEYPVVADIDGDTRAELVVTANEGTIRGVRAFEGGAGEWMPTRSIWNQSTYHITNVNDDGTIPVVEERGWLTYNSYRQNAALPRASEPVADLTAGLVAYVDRAAPQTDSLIVRVGNAGMPIAAGIANVSFYVGTPESGVLLGTAAIPALDIGEFADVELVGVTSVPADSVLTAVVDSSGRVTECNELNNIATTGTRPTIGTITVATDAGVYAPGSDVQILATVTNTGDFASAYVGAFVIENASGEVVATLAPFSVPDLAPGESFPVSSLWTSGSVLAGGYQARAQLFTTSDEALDDAVASFAIEHDGQAGPAASLRVGTDRPTYNTTDSVSIDALARNLTETTLMSSVQLRLTVAAPGGDVLLDRTLQLGDMAPGSLRETGETLNLSAAAEGAYALSGALLDANGDLLATANATFDVEEDLRATLSAVVSVGSPEIVSGEPQLCTYRFTNQGTLGLQAQPVRQLVVRLSDETVVVEEPFAIALRAGGEHVELRTIGTNGYPAGDYACVIAAQIEGEWRDLDYETFRVVPPPVDIEGTLSLGTRGRLLVLVDGTDGNDASDPFNGSDVPDLITQRAHIEAVLDEAGWSYTIVEYAEDFEREFDTGGYEVYAILSEAVKLPNALQNRVVSAVQQGAGLLIAGNHDRRNSKLETALGIKSLGKNLQVTSLIVEGADVMQPGEESMPVDATPLEMKLEGATAFARYQMIKPKPNQQTAAATFYDYGDGRSVYVSFDLPMAGAAAGDDSLFAQLFTSALSYIHPRTITPQAGRVLPLHIVLQNEGVATSGRVVLALPAGVIAVDARNASVQADGTLAWEYALNVDESIELDLWVRLPEQPGGIDFRALIQTGVAPDYVDHEELALTVYVQAP